MFHLLSGSFPRADFIAMAHNFIAGGNGFHHEVRISSTKFHNVFGNLSALVLYISNDFGQRYQKARISLTFTKYKLFHKGHFVLHLSSRFCVILNGFLPYTKTFCPFLHYRVGRRASVVFLQ